MTALNYHNSSHIIFLSLDSQINNKNYDLCEWMNECALCEYVLLAITFYYYIIHMLGLKNIVKNEFADILVIKIIKWANLH